MSERGLSSENILGDEELPRPSKIDTIADQVVSQARKNETAAQEKQDFEARYEQELTDDINTLRVQLGDISKAKEKINSNEKLTKSDKAWMSYSIGETEAGVAMKLMGAEYRLQRLQKRKK